MTAQTTARQTTHTTWPASSRGFVADRLVVGLLLLCIALAAAGVFLTAIGLFSPARLMPTWGPVMEQTILLPALPHNLGRVVAGATAVLVGLVAMMLLIRRIVPASPSASTQHHVLAADEHGLVLVDKKGISTVAEAAVQRVPGVVQVTVQVLGQGTSTVRLVVRTWVHAGAQLRDVGQQASERAREAVEQLVGLQVHDAVVRLHVVPMEDLDRVVE